MSPGASLRPGEGGSRPRRSRCHPGGHPDKPPAPRRGSFAVLPDDPGRVAAFVATVQLDLVLEGVHGGEEALVWLDEDTVLFRRPEQTVDEILAGFDQIDELLAEGEEPRVEPDIRRGDRSEERRGGRESRSGCAAARS